MDDKKVALLPCPFCGSTDLWAKHLEGTIVNPAYAVVCDNCGAQSRYSDRDYIAAWNTRQPTDARIAREAVIEECARVAEAFNVTPAFDLPCTPFDRTEAIVSAIRNLKDQST